MTTMAEDVRSTGPVSTVGNFPGRGTGHSPQHSPKKGPATAEPARPTDQVSVGHVASSVLRLLRERVLASTREALGVDEGHATPEFAEILEGEPVPAFLGRLLSAQNQLAASRRAHGGELTAAVVRSRCDDALLAGANETLELLAANPHVDPTAATIVAEVLAEHARRIAALDPSH